MVLQLHGFPVSNFTQKVLITLIETKTPYELVLVNLAQGETYSEAYMARNPFGAVPCLVSKWLFSVSTMTETTSSG